MPIDAPSNEAAPPEQGEPRVWQPSRRPAHAAASAAGDQGRIVELGEAEGPVARLRAFFRRPFVRLVAGLALFIAGAVLYDTFVNYGSWTERAEKQKATKHRGLEPIKQSPDG
jgi:hypothetical protein